MQFACMHAYDAQHVSSLREHVDSSSTPQVMTRRLLVCRLTAFPMRYLDRACLAPSSVSSWRKSLPQRGASKAPPSCAQNKQTDYAQYHVHLNRRLREAHIAHAYCDEKRTLRCYVIGMDQGTNEGDGSLNMVLTSNSDTKQGSKQPAAPK